MIHHRCLACGGMLEDSLFDINDLPFVDSFRADAAQAAEVPRHSISLRQCDSCFTIQVASPPDTSEIYKQYIYESSSSPDLLAHFSGYAEFVRSTCKGGPLLEIGANDGLLLKELEKVGFTNLTAMDPSPQTGTIDSANVRIINEFFDESSATRLPKEYYSTIIANNCFSHIPNLTLVLSLCKELLTPEGIIIVEVQSTLDLIENVVFDYIYHEHYFYHTVSSFSKVARLSGLELFSVKHVETKGGSYRLLLGKELRHKIDGSVSYWMYREHIARVHSASSWASLKDYLATVKGRLHELINHTNRTVIGYGASATGTVFMKYMEIEGLIKWIVDDNKKRQGSFSPGAAIPVRAYDSYSEDTFCIILAWRHAKYIAPKLQASRIPYIVPLPTLSVHG